MFPRLREQIGTALDLLVEFSTLGEYRLAMEASGAASAPVDAPGQAPQLGGATVPPWRAAVRRTVAGGATGKAPVATPAARRRLEKTAAQRPARPPARSAQVCGGTRRRPTEHAKRTAGRPHARKSAPAAPEQLCLAV